MKLIKSEEEEQTTEPAETTEAEPEETEPQEADRNILSGEANWPLRAALLLVAVGLIVGLVFLARWIYHLAHHQSISNQPTASQSQSQSSPSASVGPGGSQKSTSPSKNSQPLPNNGPGNVIGVFAAASFAAGALHYIISLRKAVRED